MARWLVSVGVALGLVYFVSEGGVAVGATPTRADRAFQKFWTAETPTQTAAAIDAIVAARVSFQEAVRRLKAGRPYLPQKAGIFKLSNRTEDGVAHDYLVKVPEGYDPHRRYAVRIQLHGDVHGDLERREADPTDLGPFEGDDQFHVRPYASAETPWWSTDQLLNLRAILDRLKRTYNIDENRVVLTGESDGGTGGYYLGMRDTTPFSTFFLANAFVMVLGNEGLTLNDQIFPNNLRNKPLFVVNGGRDPLYPTDKVDPYIEHMKANGVRIDYHPQPDAVHDTAWWPQLKPTFEQFVAEHPRNPVPDQLTWEVADADQWNRAHWLVIDELAPEPEDPNQAADPGRFAARRGAANPWPLFAYQPPAARVDVVRRGNLVTATAEGVAAFTLLLSPDRLDFRHPVRVVVNDNVIFDGPMVPNLRMLLKWASIDNDRTMLFAAELHVRVDN